MKNIFCFFLLLFISGKIGFTQAGEKPNIIFIIVDDLNDYTETLGGHPQTSTPGINQIEAWGTTFLNAHAPAPKCAPSRTSMLTGKDIYYTQQYNNPACKPFRNYFTVADGNEEIYTLPEQLRENGYFTYGINKIFHCFDSYPDFDTVISEPCDKQLSWNKYSWFDGADDPDVVAYGSDNGEGVHDLTWARIPDSMEYKMYDSRAIDSALIFIDQFQSGTINTCGNPFCMMIGLRKPHEPWYIPEHYFSENYIADLYATPFNLPFNFPENTFPYNGIVMPPQPDTIYNDFYHLASLGQQVASFDSIYFGFLEEVDHITPLPEIDPGLSDEERKNILNETLRANAVMAYLAATKFIDSQIKRFLDTLVTYPDIFNNTILVFISDNGFSLGEKRHWQKSTMWETDLRVPFTIADLRSPAAHQVTAAVNLLDIFPTICAITETPFPAFSDGSFYLDGKSLVPFLENAEVHIEKPSLASYRTGRNIQCACYPQYSIRTNDFHYILYTSNNADNIIECDFSQSWKEEELYEIGTDRETDPNEWNNLANDSSYRTLMDYLQQYLPDSAMYLKTPYTTSINQNELNCLLTYSDTLHLGFDVYDTAGLLIAAPAGYIYEWSNNLTTDILYGTSVDFVLASIPEDIFIGSTRMLLYLRMIDPANQTVVSLAYAYYYFDSGDVPEISFNLIIDSLTVSVTDIAISGTYTSLNWNFGDGFNSNALMPPPHTYSEGGYYVVTCTVTYGNSDACKEEKSYSFVLLFKPFFTGALNALKPLAGKPGHMDFSRQASESGPITFKLFPNPASDKLSIQSSSSGISAVIQIMDSTGRILIHSGSERSIPATIDISSLPAGNYIAKISTAQNVFAGGFQIVK